VTSVALIFPLLIVVLVIYSLLKMAAEKGACRKLKWSKMAVYLYSSPPLRLRSASVSVSLCLSVCSYISKTTNSMLAVAVAWSYVNDDATRYVQGESKSTQPHGS